MCPSCNILQSRPLTAASFEQGEHAAELRPSACKACKRGARKHYVPQPDDVPSEAAVAALRPLDFDLGPENRAENGYRKHVRMIRFSWAAKAVKQKIADLPERAERRKARATLQYLLEDGANAYRKFYADHLDFLSLHNNAPSEVAAKRPLHFIEELGLECAAWQHSTGRRQCVRRTSATPITVGLRGSMTMRTSKMWRARTVSATV